MVTFGCSQLIKPPHAQESAPKLYDCSICAAPPDPIHFFIVCVSLQGMQAYLETDVDKLREGGSKVNLIVELGI